MGKLVNAGKVGDVKPGTARLVEAGGRRIALFNIDGQFYALDDECSHVGGPLSEGDLSGHQVTCPWHGSIFDVRTGRVLRPPSRRPMQTFKVVVERQEIKVELP